MKKILCLFGVLTFALASCTSENSSDSASLIKPKKIIHLDSNYSEIYFTDVKYEGEKLLSLTDSDGYSIKFTYTGDFITKIEVFESITVLQTTTEYTYLNGKMITAIQRRPNEIKYLETKYTHNEDDVISYITKQVNSEPGEIVGGSGKYTYKNGNIIKSESGSVLSEQVYEYDAKKNPMRNFLGIKLLIGWTFTASLNNIIRYSNISDGSETTYTYSYNKNGFPTEQKEYGYEGDLYEVIQYVY